MLNNASIRCRIFCVVFSIIISCHSDSLVKIPVVRSKRKLYGGNTAFFMLSHPRLRTLPSRRFLETRFFCIFHEKVKKNIHKKRVRMRSPLRHHFGKLLGQFWLRFGRLPKSSRSSSKAPQERSQRRFETLFRDDSGGLLGRSRVLLGRFGTLRALL